MKWWLSESLELTFTKSDQLDGSHSSISFNDFDAFNGLWQHLGNEVVIKEEGLEQPCRRDWAGDLIITSERGHDALVGVWE